MPPRSRAPRSQAEHAAIGLAILAAHVALILLLCLPRRTREPETAAESVVTLYFAAPLYGSVRRSGRPGASPHSSSRAAAPRASRHRGRKSRRAALLARHPASQAPPVRSGEQAKRPAARIDWNAQVEHTVKQELAREEIARERASALTRHSGVSAAISAALRPPPPKAPEFGWSPPRVRVVNGIGIFVQLNDHCAVIISVMLMGGCAFGKIEPRGDLFAHMHDVKDPEDPRLP